MLPASLKLAPKSFADPVGVGWALRVCSPDEFPGDGDAVGPGSRPSEPWAWGK